MKFTFEREFGKIRYVLSELGEWNNDLDQYTQIFFQPVKPFRVSDIRINGDIEIDIVYIGNIIATAFIKRQPICLFGERITIQIKPRIGNINTSKIIVIGDEV